MGNDIEAAAKRERGALAPPKPDPDWKDICAKCSDGEIEPDCEYYGEPNGCNSPICGKHPTTEKSSAVGNVGAMREACANIAEYAKAAKCHTEDAHLLGYLEQIERWAKAALAAPARNCDVGTAEEQEERYHRTGEIYHTLTLTNALEWAQMPYGGRGGGK